MWYCVTCNQGGADIPNCTGTGVVYESICSKCNPSSLEKGELKEQEGGIPSLYVGETARSIQERAEEHWGAAHKGCEKSHMVRHQRVEHPGEEPTVIFKLVSSHKTALGRQVREAIRIKRRGGAANILNSKGEFNRCHIPRLVVEEESTDQKLERRKWEQSEKDKKRLELEQEDSDWQRSKVREQDRLGAKRRRNSHAGEEQLTDQDLVEGAGRRKLKKLKFTTIEEGWGEEDVEQLTLVEEEHKVVSAPPPVIPPPRSTSKTKRVNSVITDYFGKRKRMSEDWSDEEWWTNYTQDYVGVRGSRATDQSEDGRLGDSRTGQEEKHQVSSGADQYKPQEDGRQGDCVAGQDEEH